MTGALTRLAAGPWEGEDEADRVVFHPSRPVMYWASSVDVRAFTVAADGGLTALPGSPYPFNNNTDTCVSRGGRLIYVLHQSEDTVRVASLEVLGSLPEIPGSPWKTGTNPFAMVSAVP